MIHKFILNTIMVLHGLFILFVIVTPFKKGIFLKLVHFIVIPFIMLHWATNNNQCALTILENTIRTKIYGSSNDADCITYKLISPIYDFNKNFKTFSAFLYIVTFLLWFKNASDIYKMYKTVDVKSFNDFIRMIEIYL